MTLTKLHFGVGFAASVPAAQVIDTAREAERLGYDVFWVTDSHLVVREAMVMLGAIAATTQRIRLGPGVSHLAGRHPSVIASAMATLNDLAPGRIRLGIGVGDSGPLNLGVPRSTLTDLETAITDIRAMISGGNTSNPAHPLRLGYVSEPRESPVPIYMAATGRRALQVAGRVADAALISGMPDTFPGSIELVRAGEREAGRAPGSTRILFWGTACVAEDRQTARTAVRGSVARRAMNTYRRNQEQLSEEDRTALARLEEAHHRGYLWDSGYTDLVPERWIDRFAVAGTPEDVRARLEAALAAGADEISLILMSPTGARGSTDQLSMFAETVMAPLRAAKEAAPA